jgi:hypothetical protein
VLNYVQQQQQQTAQTGIHLRARDSFCVKRMKRVQRVRGVDLHVLEFDLYVLVCCE